MKVSAWMVLKAIRANYGYQPTDKRFGSYAGQARIDNIKIARIAQNKPNLGEDEIAVEIDFDVAEENFLEGTAKITATVRAPDPSDRDILATVDHPTRGRKKSEAAAAISNGSYGADQP